MALACAVVSPSSILLSSRCSSRIDDFVFRSSSSFSRFNHAPRVSTVSRRNLKIVAKALGDGSESSSGNIVEYVQNAMNSPEDRIALIGLGFASVVAIWASNNLISAIDRLPVIPGFLEFVGILFSWWFVYRYLLFKPAREEFFRDVKKSIADVLGQ